MRNYYLKLKHLVAPLLGAMFIFAGLCGDAPARDASHAPLGGVIQFGGHDWRVLDVQNNRALIITENIIERRPYNVELDDVTWETSTLRRYLNGEFLQKFSREDQARIAETRIRITYGMAQTAATTPPIRYFC